ncbi:MAG TPA: hypothetical protein VGK73_01035 [Polyangiaceae bacterium]
MSKLENVKLPVVPGVTASLGPGPRLGLSGTISTREPDKHLGIFFRELHEAALADALTEITVDVRALTFVNSSGIRLFIEWASRASGQAGRRYRLRFLRNPAVTWQRVSFSAIKNIAGEEIVIEDG